MRDGLRSGVVAVAAESVRDPSGSASRLVQVGGPGGCRAGTYPFEAVDLRTDWHHHDMHQVEYALQGTVEVETAAGHYLLPPQQALWIPAGLSHGTTIRRVRTVSVFFLPDMIEGLGERARVLAAAPIIREMILYGVRWPVYRDDDDPEADIFFTALADVVGGWLEHETPLRLPTSTVAVVSDAMAYTAAHLSDAGLNATEVARAVGVSPRTLRRAFVGDTAMTWSRYLLQSRLLRAMADLAEPAPTVLDVATHVGFESASAFSRAFRSYSGETPSAYRRRIVGD
jgi:AraC-like DNA-binding protein